MEKLVRTFLALHMAYGGGLIKGEELALRNTSHAFGRPNSDQECPALVALMQEHPDCDIRIPFRGFPLPLDWACGLLVDGYASEETINVQLRKNHFFCSRK